jgi:predicted N-acetyltransferase YhbS
MIMIATLGESESGAAEEEIRIRPMQPEDAGSVTGLMREVYGETCPRRSVYDPVLLRKRVMCGELRSAIAEGPGGTVVGYGSLSGYYGYPEIGLLGSLAVSPARRGRGIGGRLTRHLVSFGRQAGYVALTAGTFTSHPYARQAIEREGFTPTAILLGSQPQGISFPGIVETSGQRESVVFYTRILAPGEYGYQYIPDRHRPVICAICRDLGVHISATETGYYPVGGPSAIEYMFNQESGAGLIWIRKAGYDYHEVLAMAVRMLRSAGAKVLRLHLNLNDPGSPSVVTAAEALGFVFAGILPAKDGLVLLMQDLQGIAIDPEKLCIGENPAGRRLLAYIGSQIARSGGGARDAPQDA